MLRLVGFGDNAGSGFPTILDVWKSEGWIKPELIEDTNLDQVTLVMKMEKESDDKSAEKSAESAEKSAESAEKSAESAEKSADLKNREGMILSERHQQILAIMEAGIEYSTEQVAEKIGLKGPRTRQLLNELVNKELFFDSVAVNNEIKTSRYQEILCNMGYGYDVYDAYDISDDKMEVLIKNDVIEMNNVGLEYIRNHYKKYTALYIDENIEAYLRIITSDNFSYEEALHILGMEIGDEEKIDLLGLTTEPISVVGKGYSSSLIKYILDNNFDKHDENELYQHFSEYEEVIQSSIYRVAESRIANIIDNSTIVLDDNLLSQLLTMSKCSMDDKIQLWAKALSNLTEETCKKHFEELGFPELKGIFTKRNNYTKTYEDNSFIRDILYVLKKNTWIFDYYKKSDDEGYVVVKNPIKDKRY